jgi:tetratricopeptide (TPR) repeat protein
LPSLRLALDQLAALFILSLACAAFAQGPDPQKLFQEASDAQQRGDATQAVRKYQELIQLRPDMIAARANLGLALVSLGRFDEAIAQYRTALAQAPGDHDLRANLAMAYYEKGDLSKAASEFSSLHKDEPGNIQIATLLGTCYMRLGDATRAILILSPLAEAHPDNLDLKWAFGWALIRTGRTQKGFELAESVAQQRNSAEAYMLTAEAERKVLAFDRARRNVDAATRVNPHLPGLDTLSGLIMDDAGDHDGAVAAFERGLEANPNDFQAHLHLGAVLYNQRKLDAARAHLERALEIDRSSSLALYELARVKLAQGQVDTAIKDLEKVVRDTPDWVEPHVELAALYYRLHRPEDGARENHIVDQLAEEQRERQLKSHVLSQRTP